MRFIVEEQGNKVILKYEAIRGSILLGAIPGGKKTSFGSVYKAFRIEKISGLHSENNLTKDIAKSLKEYCDTHNIVVVVSRYKLGTKYIKDTFKSVGFYIDRSDLWYLPYGSDRYE